MAQPLGSPGLRRRPRAGSPLRSAPCKSPPRGGTRARGMGAGRGGRLVAPHHQGAPSGRTYGTSPHAD
eukprot:727919-Alexandrium_andersonii.AAC.1